MNQSTTNPPWPISRDVERELPWLTTNLGFRKIEDCHQGQPFGNSQVAFSRGGVRVGFVYDRGETTAWISPPSEPDNWISLKVACEFVSGQRSPEVNTLTALGELFKNHQVGIEKVFGSDFQMIKPEFDEFRGKREQENWERVVAEGRARRAALGPWEGGIAPAEPPGE